MSGMLVLLDHDTDRGNGFDGIRRLDDVLISINDEYPVLTDGKRRRLMPVGPIIHYIMHCYSNLRSKLSE